MTKPVHLDGTTLEGGGQLLRLALSLSSLTGKSIEITDIRGKRGSKSGADGGLKPAHLAGASFLAGVTNAGTQGLEVRSRHLVFSPGQSEAPVSIPKQLWNPMRYEQGIVDISITTPGSVFLILQAILPYLLFAGASRIDDKKPIKVFLEGGTNVWHSLSYEYADQVLFPMLEKKLGLGPITMKLHRRGYSQGRTQIGKIELDVTPMPPGYSLPAFEYIDRGEITKFYISILGYDSKMQEDISQMTRQKLEGLHPDAEIELVVNESSGHPSRLYLLVVAESENGYRLGRDWLYDQKINKDKPTKTVDALVTRVVRDLQMEMAHGGCVDEWLQDQLVVFQSLAEGKCSIDGRDPSLHTSTARWVAEQILDVKFNKGGHCRGIGLKAVSRSSSSIGILAEDLDSKLAVE